MKCLLPCCSIPCGPIHALLTLFALLFCACARPEPAPADPYGGDNPRDADQLWTPTQEEIDAAAADEIDPTNADEEFERLQQELDADH
jgi:hypothetical protein